MHKDSVTLSADLIIVFEPGGRRVMHRARQASVFSQHLRALGLGCSFARQAVPALCCARPGKRQVSCVLPTPPRSPAPVTRRPAPA